MDKLIPGTRVVSRMWPLGSLEPEAEFLLDNVEHLYLYKAKTR